jgi:hypothetical protein
VVTAYHNFLIAKHDLKLSDRDILSKKPTSFFGCADYCKEFFANYDQDSQISERDAIEPFVLSQGIEMPKSRNGWTPEKMRLESPKWWDKKLRIKKIRNQEALKIIGGQVRKYCSDELLQDNRETRQRMKEWLENTYIYDAIAYSAAQAKETDLRLRSKNQNGHIQLSEADQRSIDKAYEQVSSLTLKQVSDSSLSNNNLKVHELNVRCKGVGEHYQALGYRAMMITVTSPSEYHRLTTVTDSKGKKTKELNPNYNGATPKDVQNIFFNPRFALVRTYLSNRGIEVIAVRVAEPHQDGCVHWHLVMWFKNGKEAKIAVQAFRKYYLFYDGEPSKARLKHALKFDTVNPKKGDAVGYLLAYINKGITGEHIDDHTDANGEKIAEGKEGAERTQVWARCWGIRQYQFAGTPPVGTYREFRRVWCKAMGRGKKNQITVPTFEQHQALQEFYEQHPMTEDFQELWFAANEGDYGRFIKGFYDVQGQQAVTQSSNFLTLSCAIYAYFSKSYGKQIMQAFAQEYIKPAPKLLTHGFGDDLAELAKYYGNVQSVPEEVIMKLDSLNSYLEPKSQVYGVKLGDSKQLITRPFNGYFQKFWSLKTKEKDEQEASTQERIDGYATVRGAGGLDEDYWGDVVAFAAQAGVFASPRTCGNNCTQ